MLFEHAKNTVAAYISADIPVMLWGSPGVGKSDMIADIAKARDAYLYDERLSTLESVDLRGTPRAVGDRVQWARPVLFQALHEAADAGRPTILFLDEINAAAPSVQAAAFQLILNRRIGEHVLPDGCAIVAAGNRQSDRASAQRMPSALANRFAHVDLDADADAWRAWAAGAGLSPLVIAFLAFRPALVHVMPDADARAFPTPRAWTQVAKVADAPADLRPGLVRGLVGEAAAGEFEAFAKVWTRAPSIASILANPELAFAPAGDAPGDAALCYAIATGVARAMTRQNADAAGVYLARLPAEYRVAAWSDATRRDPTLRETIAFVRHATDIHQVIA
jgi:hypothetical protein